MVNSCVYYVCRPCNKEGCRIRYQYFESQVMFFITRRILPAPSVSVSELLKEDERKRRVLPRGLFPQLPKPKSKCVEILSQSGLHNPLVSQKCSIFKPNFNLTNIGQTLQHLRILTMCSLISVTCVYDVITKTL